ncbi:conjugal transfer protein TraD [Pectobacterium versatile]|uniref:conjugal transfer protein TraD n=1 Tax=Pectobacterium versatile TaxID=2488639 RepID=UPI0018EC4D23|nr:conjugal transfer protein TraD [Pectobacterium versatile]MBQ4768804.1 conjugal transfer protein TraD [Pectobacterium versatile]QQG27119.1 conjugal transfer protein TraD [Pectobacterium carotovorum]
MTRKDIKQQMASAQERLYFLEAKKKQQTKKENTRQKIIFGAEVAKVLGCDIGYVDKELVFGVLLNISKLSERDIERYRAQGQVYIENVINKSKC